MNELLDIQGLSVGYGRDARTITTAVRGVDLVVGAGEIVGVAGESGCGKSTLALAIAGLLDPPGRVLSGRVLYQGTDLCELSREQLRRLYLSEISMVFQGAMNVLNPVTRVRDQFLDAMRAHGMGSKAASARASEMFERVRIPRRFLDAYPHQLSGGMRQRAVIALSLCLSPKLLILDEPTTALDVVVQRSIFEMLDDLRHEIGFGVVFITHDLPLLVELADRIVIMYAGAIVDEAPAKEVYQQPKHPYTAALMNAFPPVGATRERREGLAGQPPDLRRLPQGCSFAPRCSSIIERTCDVLAPPDIRPAPGHRVVCHLFGEEHGKERSVD